MTDTGSTDTGSTDTGSTDTGEHGHGEHGHDDSAVLPGGAGTHHSMTRLTAAGGDVAEHASSGHGDDDEHGATDPPHYYQEVYTLAKFYDAKLSISVYIDALTVAMFAMVTLIATCIHFYATGYMHDELVDDFVDHEATMSDGSHVHRPGRYHRFFQAMSLFCFSMLGLVISGNIAMTFVFWELVGICSYFLIGFYVETPQRFDRGEQSVYRESCW